MPATSQQQPAAFGTRDRAGIGKCKENLGWPESFFFSPERSADQRFAENWPAAASSLSETVFWQFLEPLSEGLN